MAGNAASSLALMMQLAREEAAGNLTMPQAAMAKATTTRQARASIAQCRSLFGGNGIVTDYGAAKLFGDVEVLYTYEGTYEVNSLIVGRGLTGVGVADGHGSSDSCHPAALASASKGPTL